MKAIKTIFDVLGLITPSKAVGTGDLPSGVFTQTTTCQLRC